MTTVESFIEEKLEELDEQIHKIDNSKVMRAAAKLIEQKNTLMAARRALLGAGNKMTSNGGSRVTQAEVVAWFERNEGSHQVGAIAEAMGHAEATIRGHLNRGKDERFEKLDDGTWQLRDPETGEHDD